MSAAPVRPLEAHVLERRSPQFHLTSASSASRAPLLAAASVLAAVGATAFGGSEETPWSVMTPIIVAAEDGQLGAGVMAVTDATDASITYVTATVNITDAPLDLSDPRVSSQSVAFPAAGDYQICARVRVGPEGPNDDSFFINSGTEAAPSWQVVNGISGYDVEGSPRYQPAAIVSDVGGNTAPDVWKWALVEDVRLTVPAGSLDRTFSFATREDGLHIDNQPPTAEFEGHYVEALGGAGRR